MKLFGRGQKSERGEKIRRIFTIFFWGSLVPIVVISGIIYFSGQTILQNQAIESLAMLNRSQSEQLNFFIEKLKIRISDWSSDGKIRENAESIGKGEPLSEDLSLYLRDKKIAIDPTIFLVDVLDVKGMIIASNDMSRLGMDESKKRIFFPEASHASFGEVMFSPELVLEADELAGVPILHFAAPLISADTDAVVGVLLTHIKNDSLNRVFIAQERETMETYLVNRDKLLIASSRFVPNAVFTQNVDTPPVRACLDHGKDYEGSHLNYRGESVFGVSICAPDGFGVLITEIDASEALTGVAFFRNIVVLTIVLLLAFTLIYFLWIGKTLFPTTTTTTTTTTVITIITIIGIGVFFSLFFSTSISLFVRRAKAEPIFDVVQGQANRHIADANSFIDWQSDTSQQRFNDFVSALKTSLPPVAAVKIYNQDSILIWSDVAAYKGSIGKKHEEDDVRKTLAEGQLVKSVEAEIQKQIGSTNLLEIYTPVFLQDKNAAAGIAEIYFDTSDLAIFIRRMQIFIWVLIGSSLTIIYFLLMFAFRKQNKQINHQAKELATIIEQSPIGIYTLNKDGIIDSFNPKMIEFSGAKSAKEVIGLNALVLPTYKAVGLDRFFREGLQGKPFTTEVKYASYTGSKTTYRHYFGIPIFGLDGKTVERLLLMVEDITERRKLQKEIEKYTNNLERIVVRRTAQVEEEKNKLQTTLESMGDGAFAIDRKGIITFFNHTAEALSGFSAKEAFGKPFKDILKFVKEKDRSENFAFINNVFQKGKISRITNHSVLITKDGKDLAVAINAAPIKDQSGKVTGCIVVFRNVSHEREIDKMKSEFISLASHQLRTPLTAIKWLTEMLLSGDAGKLNIRQKEYLRNSYGSATRMTQLINALLNISRIESERLSVKPEPIDLVQFSKTILAEMQPLNDKKKHQLTFDKPKTLPVVKTDPRLLHEILSNLLSNAITYTPEKGKITLGISVQEPNMLFQVTDNGFGIPQYQQPRVFQKFFRGYNIVRTDTEGTGLGLYIVQKLVETLGGKIWFVSQENKGTTFSFTIPLAGIKEIKGEKGLA